MRVLSSGMGVLSSGKGVFSPFFIIHTKWITSTIKSMRLP